MGAAMKLGVNTFLWTVQFSAADLPLLPRLKQAGFDGFEPAIFSATGFASAEVRRGCADNGLECTVCSVIPRGMSVASEDTGVRRATVAHLKDCIAAVAEAGARILAGPLYTPVGWLPGRRRSEDEWRRAVESYQELGPVLASHGVTLAIEPLNRFETYFLNTADDAARLCDQVAHPNVGVLFDTFHANIEEKDIAAGYRRVGRRLKHVHACENDRGTPGSGHVEWSAVFAALKEAGYDGWLTIESFGSTIAEIANAAAIWRDLAPTNDEIAFEGVKFLRRSWES
jgi:D-psicose/D-tagatose/L-ribulose 3-epimerase